jgi:hypothetical protein
MSALYWPDFDCTPASRRMQRSDTVHVHTTDEQVACRAFLGLVDEWPAFRDSGTERYRCVRGPGGLVRGVVR